MRAGPITQWCLEMASCNSEPEPERVGPPAQERMNEMNEEWLRSFHKDPGDKAARRTGRP